MQLLKVLFLFICVHSSTSVRFKHKPEQGIFSFNLTKANRLEDVSKTLYNRSTISISVDTSNDKLCKSKNTVTFRWVIIGTHCKGEFSNPNATNYIFSHCLKEPRLCPLTSPGKYVTNVTKIECGQVVKLYSNNEWLSFAQRMTADKSTTTTVKPSDSPSRKRRNDESGETDIGNDVVKNATDTSKTAMDKENKNQDEEKPVVTTTTMVNVSVTKTQSYLASTPFVGEYTVFIGIEDRNGNAVSDDDLNFLVKINMKESNGGYLSAHEYPLLNFFMIMCIVYVFFAIAWLTLSAYNYRDLLRVQFWIGGVILLGLIEKAVHYSEYSTVNSFGKSDTGVEKFAEIVSAFKRAVSRMLVLVVSLGFGIVKPRLGPMLYRVVGIGLLYFIVAILEAMLRTDVYFEASRSAWIFMYIPLAIIDAVIFWWVFMSLLQTMKTLRLRRNTVKLSLYRHFSNTIVLCVLVSVVLMLWSIYYHEQGCVEDFSSEWFETACWPMIFSIILLVIMVLWRPNTNNQRYAYSPMIDGNDSDLEDVEEPMLGSGAVESMKIRRSNSKTNLRSEVDTTEENLKWIEENIPATVADAALPALMDSDEEVLMSKYEMSKME